ncbi:cupin domain-containing protein [Marinibaculum pumilum]|uniref:Cupin domain-containing protein n=1 Tax=Marinibaculum pumilum TaxID=1766165 RepID=A0ABV7L994_9PROT
MSSAAVDETKAAAGTRTGGRSARAKASDPVTVHPMADMAWETAGKGGLYLKSVRREQEAGRFLGLVRIEEGVRTGLHQHQDVATSYVLQGALTDYAGTVVRGQAGINFRGDTHDAIAYENCVLASRMDGPTLYAADGATDHQLHAGARQAAFATLDRSRQPDLNVTVAEQRPLPTFVPGMLMRMVFDYAGTGHDRRMVCLQLQPGTVLPPYRAGGLVDWFVVAGDITVNDRQVLANSFVVQPAGSEMRAGSGHGCMLIAWAEGPVHWLDGADRADPYGFPPA